MAVIQLLPLFIFIVAPSSAAGPEPLFNGKNLDGWQVIGDGQWT